MHTFIRNSVYLLRLLTIALLGIAVLEIMHLKQAADSLSTVYLGEFPAFMPRIQDVVKHSQKRLLVASGMPGFGIYSDYRRYREYQTALEGKASKLELKVIVIDSNGRKALTEAQFRGIDFEKEIRQTKNFKDFLSRAGKKDIKTKEEFLETLLSLHSHALIKDFSGRSIPCFERGGAMPVFVWIADDKEAVFAIPNLQGTKPKEGAFYTRDARLIKELTNIFRTYEKTAHNVPVPK